MTKDEATKLATEVLDIVDIHINVDSGYQETLELLTERFQELNLMKNFYCQSDLEEGTLCDTQCELCKKTEEYKNNL